MERTPRSIGKLVLALVVVALVSLSACSADDDDAASTDDIMSTVGGGATASAGNVSTGAGGDGGGDEAPPSGDGAVTDVGEIDLIGATERKIVYRGDIASEVDDVVSAVRSARDEVAAEGGFVFAQEVSAGSARVVLKVPSVRFDAAFDAVATIGEVTSQSIEADDVTEKFTDLESRRATLETSIVRLRGFLAETANVDEISRLESELTRREAERDVIAGQLRVLEDRTSFATISASFTEPAEREQAATDDASGPPGFGRGLEVGWDGVVFAAGVLATATGFLLPFVPVLVAAGALLWWLRRRHQLEINRLAG